MKGITARKEGEKARRKRRQERIKESKGRKRTEGGRAGGLQREAGWCYLGLRGECFVQPSLARGFV